MATLLYRLGKTAFRRWPLFIAAWVVALVAVGAVAGTLSQPMSDKFSIPGIPSEQAADLQAELFPGAVDPFDQASVNMVVVAPEGETLDQPRNRRAVDALLADVAGLPQMPEEPALVNPVDAAGGMRAQMLEAAAESGMPEEQAQANADALAPLSEDGRAGIVTWDFDVESPAAVEPATKDQLMEVMADAEESGLRVEANGPGMQAMPQPSIVAELIGIGVALLVLVLTFGSLVAAGWPILTALLGVGLTAAGITAMTAFTDIGSTTPILATMIGLAVGIDYALFILARYQHERHETDDLTEAVGRATGTAGSAVVFAGLTVMIALGALAVVRIPFLTSMGVAAAIGVLVAVLIALTLLPAVLGLVKAKAFALRVHRIEPRRDERGRIVNNGVRWARVIEKRPVVFVLATVVLLGGLAIPMKDLRLAFPTDSTAPTDTTNRQASDLITDHFGPGREAPMLVVADGRDLVPEERPAAFGEVVAWAADRDGVLNAQVVGMNEAGDGAQVLVTPTFGPDEPEAQELLTALRDGQDAVEDGTGLDLGVTGLTAITTDVSDRLNDALAPYLVVVIGLAFLILILVFRSLLVPLTATFGFLLSVLGTLGATVAVFQDEVLGLMESTPIVSFMPIFLIGVVFGLAMDYQVFLVTRVREAYVHGADAHASVVEGFRNSARVVTAAALIMISVFAAFVVADDPTIKMMGFGLAVAVALDAFVVRMTLIPALMYLMGDKAWWMPSWLDRLVPRVDIEGEDLLRHPEPLDGEIKEPVAAH